MNNRARIFMPFSALKGFKEALKEKETIVVDKKELSFDSLENLEYKIKQIKVGQMIKVIYFNSDRYLKIEGLVSKINFSLKSLTIVKTIINFQDIYEISGAEIMDLIAD